MTIVTGQVGIAASIGRYKTLATLDCPIAITSQKLKLQDIGFVNWVKLLAWGLCSKPSDDSSEAVRLSYWAALVALPSLDLQALPSTTELFTFLSLSLMPRNRGQHGSCCQRHEASRLPNENRPVASRPRYRGTMPTTAPLNGRHRQR